MLQFVVDVGSSEIGRSRTVVVADRIAHVTMVPLLLDRGRFGPGAILKNSRFVT